MDGVMPLTGNFEELSAVAPLANCTSANTPMMQAVGAAYNAWRNSLMSKWANVPIVGTSEESMESPRYAYFDRYHGINVLCYQGRQMSYSRESGYINEETPGRGHLAGCEFVDSSSKEWSGHIAFRESTVGVEKVHR